MNENLLKGGIATFELIVFSFVGITFNHIYSKFIHDKEDNMNRFALKAILYIFALCTFCFFVRSLTKDYFMKFTNDIWPEPVMFGFGMLLFQRELLQTIITHIYTT